MQIGVYEWQVVILSVSEESLLDPFDYANAALRVTTLTVMLSGGLMPVVETSLLDPFDFAQGDKRVSIDLKIKKFGYK